MEQKYTALLKQLERVDAQEEELKQLRAKFDQLNSGNPEAGFVDVQVVKQVGLTPAQNKKLRTELSSIRQKVERMMTRCVSEKQFAEHREKVLKEVTDFRKAYVDLKEQKGEGSAEVKAEMKHLRECNAKLNYRVMCLKRSLTEATRKPDAPQSGGKIAAVIFDCDGLLVDSEPFWRQAEMELFATVGINLSEQDCIETTGMRISEIVKLRYSEKPWEGISIYELTKQIESRVAELIRTKASLKPGVAHAMDFCRTNLASARYMTLDSIQEGKYYTITRSLKQLKDAWIETMGGGMDDDFYRPLLGMKVRAIDVEEDDATVNCRLDNNFDSQWIPVGCLHGSAPMLFAVCSSSSPEIIDSALSLMTDDMRSQFTVIQSCEDLDYAKPHPLCYLMTAERLGVNPTDCLVFEDSFRGTLAALSAQMKCVAVPEENDGRFGGSDIVLNSLEEVSEQSFGKFM